MAVEQTITGRKPPKSQTKKWLALGLVLAVIVGIVVSQLDTVQRAARSYVFAYPLVMTELTRNKFIKGIAPLNRLVNVPVFPDANFRDVVRPNVDTLYSVAWFDLSQGPQVLELPATERYHVMQFLDAWTNVFASLGPRTTGSTGGRYLVAGPDWQGTAPEGMRVLRSPTQTSWLLGRVQTNGAADYPVVHAIQAQMKLTSLAEWLQGKQTDTLAFVFPPAGKPTLFQIRDMPVDEFYGLTAKLLVTNPAKSTDGAAIAELKQLGVVAGRANTDWNWLQHQSIKLGAWLAQRKMSEAMQTPQNLHRGWRMLPKTVGAYGTDYGLRAVVSMAAFGANLAQDAVYPVASVDADGQPLQGGNHYRLHFAKGQLPPANAFWSLTVYDADGYFIANPMKRYALGDRDPLVRNADGSLDILLQADEPAPAMRANWLPTSSSGAFSLTGRLYLPTKAVIDGDWNMPGMELLP